MRSPTVAVSLALTRRSRAPAAPSKVRNSSSSHRPSGQLGREEDSAFAHRVPWTRTPILANFALRATGGARMTKAIRTTHACLIGVAAASGSPWPSPRWASAPIPIREAGRDRRRSWRGCRHRVRSRLERRRGERSRFASRLRITPRSRQPRISSCTSTPTSSRRHRHERLRLPDPRVRWLDASDRARSVVR